MKKRTVVGYLACVFAGAGLLAYLGCGGSSPGSTGCTTCPLPSLAGSWAGTWTDTRYNVTGPITATLQQTATSFSSTGTIDLTSLGLGSQNGTATGTISGNALVFTFTSGAVGSGSGTLTGTAGSGTGNVTAMNFGGFTFTGTVSDTIIDGTFNFTSPTGGRGTIHLTKR